MDVLQDRSLEQRHAALAKGNEIRSYRAARKKDVKAGRAPADFFLVHGPHDPLLQSMRLRAALIAMPGISDKRANYILTRAFISPAKTLGGVTDAQWKRLYAVLVDYPSVRRRLSGTGGSIPS